MFQCESTACGRTTKPNQPVNRIVTEYRSKVYENKILRGRHKGEMRETFGQEIVTEIKVCPECFVLITGEKPVTSVVKARSPSPRRFEKTRPRRDERPPRKKWNNPRNAKTKGKNTSTPKPERKKPIVQVVNKLSNVPIVKE